jgi:predicted PurR-regulated permease PerM
MFTDQLKKGFPVVAVALLGLALLLLWHASQLLLVVFAAVLFAIFVDGLAASIGQRLPVSQGVTRAIVVILLVTAMIGFLMIAGPRFSDQVSQLIETLPRAIERLNELIQAQSWGGLLKNIEIVNRIQPKPGQILASVTGVFSTAFEALANVVVIFFIGLYLAIQPDLYVQGFLRLVPPASRERGAAVLHALWHVLSRWMVGRFASMAAVGVLTTICLELIGMPLALVLGVIAGLLSFVPYIGPIASVVPAMLIGLTVSPMMAVYALVLYWLVQFIEGNLLTPLIQKHAVSLPPAIMLLAQVAMGIYFGLFGVLLATPLALVLIVLVQMLYVQDVLGDSVRVLGEQ